MARRRAPDEKAERRHATAPTPRDDLRNRAAVCALLVLLTLAVFGRSAGHDFVDFDDPVYVYDNPVVARGLTWEGVGWAFGGIHARNWHPLTWVSHMLDCSLFGLDPAGHHAVNVLLHGANAALLFLVLRRMTGMLGASAFVAALFAVHPLRIESVAWVAERKDLLCGFFFLLTLAAYAHFVTGPLSIQRYGWVVLALALGLLSKPMLVTVPLLLLLLDFWPLGRIQGLAPATGRRIRAPPVRVATLRTAVLEKLPLVALVLASSAMTLVAQQGAITRAELLPFDARVSNALVSYVVYLGKTAWPSALAIPYPYRRGGISGAEVALSTLVLLAASAFALWRIRLRPHLAVGWLWYLGMLVPVIGLVQVGSQARADRYTYLPQIGVFLLVVFGAVELAGPSRRARRRLAVAGACVVLAYALVAARQTSHWRDSYALWSHSVEAVPDNVVAMNNLAWLLATDPDAARRDGRRAVSLAEELMRRGGGEEPGVLDTLAAAYAEEGRMDDAARTLSRAIEIAEARGDARFVEGARRRQRLYLSGMPLRETPRTADHQVAE
ncbi:MAG TPA: hypothetical protein VMW35_22195 [Myxococcota bacterium]|jgi:hypothetical protein|nr:hypothetical protein [Myxococcota bacterium]